MSCAAVRRTIVPRRVDDGKGVCTPLVEPPTPDTPQPSSLYPIGEWTADALAAWDAPSNCDATMQNFSCPLHFPSLPLYVVEADATSYASPVRHASCAVVGSGGSLLGSGCGAEIDSHGLIIRTNLPRVDGYAADVGSNTTLALINYMLMLAVTSDEPPANVPDSHDPDPRPLDVRDMDVVAMFGVRGAGVWTVLSEHAERVQHRGARRVLALSHDFSRLANRWLHQIRIGGQPRAGKPSTGIWSVLLGLSLCDRVDVYGYQPEPDASDDDSAPLPYHCDGLGAPRTLAVCSLGSRAPPAPTPLLARHTNSALIVWPRSRCRSAPALRTQTGTPTLCGTRARARSAITI